MDPVSAAIQGGTTALSSILSIGGSIAQLIRNGASDEELKRAIAAAHGIEIPDAELMKIKAQVLTPEADVGGPETRAAQMEALRRLSGIASAGGMDPESVSALQQAEEASARSFRNNSAAMMRDQMARGTLNSGATMASNLAGAQTSANMLNRSGVQAAGDARTRALSAIAETGRLGGNIASADDERAQRNKAAREAIKQFNSSAALKAAQSTAENMLGRTSAQVNRSGRINEASSQFANAGKDAGKPYQDMSESVGRSGAALDKLQGQARGRK